MVFVEPWLEFFVMPLATFLRPVPDRTWPIRSQEMLRKDDLIVSIGPMGGCSGSNTSSTFIIMPKTNQLLKLILMLIFNLEVRLYQKRKI